jgi:MFS family permease
MVSPALNQIAEEFSISTSLERAMVLSIFTLGYSFGPFVLAPTSEIYGRVYVVQAANIFYIIWNLLCGFAQSKTQLLVFRLLAGLGGSATLGVGGGVLSDVWLPHQRGRGIAVYTLAPVLGPAIGPIAGGFISEHTTWRWGFWSITIANMLVQILACAFLRETYAPLILGQKADRLRRETGIATLYTKWDDPDRTLAKLYAQSFSRPWKLLFTQPIIQVLAVYNAYNYGLLYIFISTFPTLWEDIYGQSPGVGGLNFISLAIGNLVASQICAPCNDIIYKALKRRYAYRHDEEGVPEFRLPLMVLGSLLTPVGLFLVRRSPFQIRGHR